MIVAVSNTQWPLAGPDRLVASTNAIAMLLFQDSLYIFCLQVVAVLLTAAVIGGVFLAKRETARSGERETATLERLRSPIDVTATRRTGAVGRSRGRQRQRQPRRNA